jgi:hypothetical protein
MEATTDTAVDAVRRAAVISSVVGHLKENRMEYAVFTLLAYSVGLIDKAMTYGQGICV